MFRTEINPQKANFELDLQEPILSMGSCFADMIGDKLTQNKFKTLVNPFGITFNPISLFKLFHFLPEENQLIHNQGVWYHYDFHSELASVDKELLIQKIREKQNDTQQFLQQSKVLIITLGTAFAYYLLENEKIVANCHRLPAYLFEKRLLNTDEIISSFEEIHPHLPEDLKIILTVSPVRHTRDTLPLNSLSKSVLRLVCHQITEKYPNTVYFPSYEMMMDDLRDYRFYKDDMIHPNETAEKYIWEIFSKTFFNQDTQKILSNWQKIEQSLKHKPFRPESEKYRVFLQKTLEELKSMSGILDLEQEIEKINYLLKK